MDHHSASRKRKHDSESNTSHKKQRDKHEHQSGLTSKSRNIDNLLQALDEVLDDTDMGTNNLAPLALRRCIELRSVLRQQNVPQSISPFSITPWSISTIPTTIPQLPEILDPTLEAAAFIHQGCTRGNVNDLSYERLEWVGDAYLYLTATLLISQTFPALLPGKCSQLRERLVKNLTLAGYARDYGFHKRAKLPPEHSESLHNASKEGERIKILGDIFEAYIGAIILSDPVDGVTRCSEWLKALWARTLSKEIGALEQGPKIDSQLWRLRGSDEPVQIFASPEERVLSSKEKLRSLIVSKGITLTYKDAGAEKKDPKNNLPIFTVGVFLDGWGEKDKKLGWGSAHGKKEAGNKAADMALTNLKALKVYIERKRLHDAQVALEEEALAKGSN